MGLLINGEWHDQWYDTRKSKGHFVRSESGFRNWVAPNPDAAFPVEAGRYHLYVSLACPWAHRTLIFRLLKGLQDVISVSVVHPHMLENGWEFGTYPDCVPDPHLNANYLYQIYQAAKSDYTGRVTVPILWDKQQHTIVNNESSEIIRMFNRAFQALATRKTDYYPEPLRPEINRLNQMIYSHVNNGVYKAGFATTQTAYSEAVTQLFETLDYVDRLLVERRYLTGDHLTEADWRLFTTLIRFDPVYVGHFKCNLRTISSYPNLSGYLRELYQFPGIAATCNLDHIKTHYYYSHANINPTRIIPKGPVLDWQRPHGRGN